MQTEHAIKETTNYDNVGSKVKDYKKKKKKKNKKQAVWLDDQVWQ